MSIQPDLPPLSEPPLSPLPVNGEPAPAVPLLRAAPDPVAPPPSQVTLEAQLLRFRLVAPDQMSQAMRMEAETGKPVAETVVEQGWVTSADLQTVIASLDPDGSQEAPEAETSPVLEMPSLAPQAVEEAVPPAQSAAVLEPVPAPPPLEPARLDPEPAFTTPGAPAPDEPEPELPPAAVAVPEPAPVTPVAPQAGRQTRVLVRFRDGGELVAGSYDDAASARQHAKELVDGLQSADAWLFVAGRSLAPVDIDRIYLG